MNKLFKKILKLIKKNKAETVLIFFSLIFSWWLMFATFSYKDGSMLIATKAWSDFASHIPLIRSFSFGSNFLPEYPIFPGLPIRYHFLFYLIAGFLEKSGFRIDYALNIPSIIGFAGLMLMLYLFAKLLFKSKAVGIFSVVFFLFNGSLSFVYFLKDHSLFSSNFLSEIFSNNTFPSFAPYYGNGIVSAFWNLNIYTNQRHLAISYALSLFLIYLLLKKILGNKKISLRLSLLLGIVLGLSFILNMAVFAMTILVGLSLIALFKKYWSFLLVFILTGIIVALPFYLYFYSQSSHSVVFYPGYLVNENLNIFSFLHYWLYNLGLHIILIPLGLLIAPKNIRRIFLPFLALFILANLFRFSLEIAANHKFINFFMLIGIMFSSYFLFFLWQEKKILRPVVLIIIFLLVFSGIIDFFPIYNDKKIALADYPISSNIQWVMKNTPKDTVF